MTQRAASKCAFLKRRLDHTENTNSESELNTIEKEWAIVSAMRSLPFFVIMTLIGICGSHLPSSRVCVSSSTISMILPVFLHSSTKPIRMQHVTIPTSIHPVTVQQSVLRSSIHVSSSVPEGTAIPFAAACLTKGHCCQRS